MTSKHITFTHASPIPDCGYRFRYRVSGTTGSYTTALTEGNSFNITGLTDNEEYEYILDSDCCDDDFSEDTVIGLFNTYNDGGRPFNIHNKNVSGGNITNVTPGVYVIGTGSFPLTSGQNILAIHAGFTGAIAVTITGTFAAAQVRLVRNNSITMQTIPVNAAGTFTFTSATFSTTQRCDVYFELIA